MRRVKLAVLLLSVLLIVYIVLAGQRAVVLLTSGDGIAIAMGVALIVLPLIGIWALLRELVFGVRAEQLGTRLEAEGGLPAEEVPVRASGRPLRDAADGVFPTYRAQAEAEPTSWRAWYRLGIVYDAAGDRRRARAAVRRAIALERQERRAGGPSPASGAPEA